MMSPVFLPLSGYNERSTEKISHCWSCLPLMGAVTVTITITMSVCWCLPGVDGLSPPLSLESRPSCNRYLGRI